MNLPTTIDDTAITLIYILIVIIATSIITRSIAYSMNKLLDRGRFFVDPGEDIYAGQVVGEHTRERDLNINICKTKKLTNVRAAGSDEKIILPPAIKFSLEEALEDIQDDELVEVTPHHMRIRKILLDPLARKRNSDSEDC